MTSAIPSHPLVPQLLSNFRVDDRGLQRLGLFMMAHANIDIRLIALAIEDEIRARGGNAALSLDDRGEISDQMAAHTFLAHLKQATSRGLLPDEYANIARDLNTTRDNFLHWNRHRGFRAIYQGQDVSTDEGFTRSMDDATRFLMNIPWPSSS